MKPTSTHYEILFFTGTSLASRQLTSKEENGKSRLFSTIEELEKACWNGILHEIFPEILGNAYPKCESFLWQVMPGKNFLYINIGEIPVAAEQETSIDPYFYMMTICDS